MSQLATEGVDRVSSPTAAPWPLHSLPQLSPGVIPVSRPRLPSVADLLPYLQTIDERCWYSNFGPLATMLEEQMSAHLGMPEPCVVTTANATAGITAALLARNAPPRSLCIMPSWTFAATPHAAHAAGLTPWFHDVDSQTWAFDPEAVRETIERIARPVGAVLVVSPFGAPIDVHAWQAFEDRTGIPVVVDAAAGFDTVRASRIPAVVSLHATKILGAGEGGFIVTTDSELRERIRSCCNFGFLDSRSARTAAINGKMSEYHAAVALAGLARWPEIREQHVHIATWYRRGVAAVKGAALQPGYGNGWVSATTSMVLPSQSALFAACHLLSRGIDTRAWWGHGCHVQPAFADYPRGPLPVTEDLGARVLGLPHFPGIQEQQVEIVMSALSELLR